VEASADPIPGEPSAEQDAPVRQPGLVTSLGFGGLHPGLTGLLQIQPGDARALLLLTGLVAALVLAALVTDFSMCFIAGTSRRE
jgi:hypothetical protein